jgi:isopropylmalate/homocitrate/citramalate synthase
MYDLVRTLRGCACESTQVALPWLRYGLADMDAVEACDIEIHLHDDTGCVVVDAYCALWRRGRRTLIFPG